MLLKTNEQKRFDDLCGQDGRYEAFLQIGGV
jgi:hypothetical protein